METEISPKAIAITTGTFYSNWYKGKLKNIKDTDKVRGDLALEFIKKSIKLGYQTVVVDVLSNKYFLKRLAGITGLTLIKKKVYMKRSPSRRLAFKTASHLSGVSVIIYIDPEKISLLKSVVKIVKPIFSNKAVIAVPKRQDKLFRETYPIFQYKSEVDANLEYNHILKAVGLLSKKSQDLDLFFGPKAFRNNKKMLNLFLRKYSFKNQDTYFDPEDYSNAIFFPVILALNKKLKVESVTVDFSYPKLQKQNETSYFKVFKEKRENQKESILMDLKNLLRFLGKDTDNLF